MAIVFKHHYKFASLIGIGTIKFCRYSELPQLSTPQNVSANGTTVSWDAVENATSYAVLADGSEIGTVEGTVTEDVLTGTWVFNNTINASGNLWFDLYFTCDGKQGTSIMTDEGWLNYGGIDSPVYTESGWKNEVYKTITITSKLSEVTNGDELLAYLQSNAIKQ